MIVCRTPLRISFLGGGTDYEAWYRQHGGAVLSAAIDRYCTVCCRFPPKSATPSGNPEPAEPMVRAAVGMLALDGEVEVRRQHDLPVRAGLGSSSAFAVGLVHALSALGGEQPDAGELARRAIHLERRLLGETVGMQDQIAAAFGGLNRIRIDRQGGFTVSPLGLDGGRMAELERHLLLVHTGVLRHASPVAAAQVAAIPRRQRELACLQALVDDAAAVLSGDGDLADFGRLLDDGWWIKRSLCAAVAPPFVDQVYAGACRAGALGGKLLGAGGGGFMLFFVPPDRHGAVRRALAPLPAMPVGFAAGGSRIEGAVA